ncbi:SCO family protein [Bacillus sp. JCM 19041]|uniref:SCO family protein n=1 Tax=Bacillus sp. JCM 19041 TaxID=1460637 RepID=UPI000B19B7CE
MKVILGLFVLITLSGCSWMYELGQSSEFDMSEADITVPAFSYTNQENEAFGSNELKGDYWLANFAFTNCTTVCLTMMPNMSYLQNTLKEEGHNLPFVTFSVDPEQDTPEQLHAYATNIGAETDEWAFLTGYEVEEIESFAREGFKAVVSQGDTPEEVIHPTSFFLIDKDGGIIRKYNGLELNQEEITEDITKVLREDS